jgi:hypothetical protein
MSAVITSELEKEHIYEIAEKSPQHDNWKVTQERVPS